ncbi:putative EF-hand domain pair protein [Tanacetum coccineum]
MVDDNHDGRISQEELKEALHGLRIWFGRWKAKTAMKSVDSNRSGTIDSPAEMEKLVKFAEKHLHMKIYES